MLRRGPELRWWWFVGLGWLALWVTVLGSAWQTASYRRWLSADPKARLLVMLPLLVGVAWLVVIAPLLESGTTRFDERRRGRRRARLCRVFAWLPTLIFTLLLIQVLVVKALALQDFGWFGRSYVLSVAGAILLSLFYGRIMSRHLLRRVRAAAARAGVCFSCSYDVSYLVGARCPECGAPLPAPPP